MARLYLLNRLLGVVTFFALLSLMWFNAGSAERYLRTYSSSKQAKQPAAASALAGDKQPQPTSIFDGSPHDVDARPNNVLIPSTGTSDVQPDVDAQKDNVKTPSTSTPDKEPEADAQKDNAKTPSTSTPDKEPDVDAQPHNATTPSTSVPSPFPPLPPPDDEEYMSICMAGEHS